MFSTWLCGFASHSPKTCRASKVTIGVNMRVNGCLSLHHAGVYPPLLPQCQLQLAPAPHVTLKSMDKIRNKNNNQTRSFCQNDF